MFAIANDASEGQRKFRQRGTEVEETWRETLSPASETGKRDVVNGACHCLRTRRQCMSVSMSMSRSRLMMIKFAQDQKFCTNEGLTKRPTSNKQLHELQCEHPSGRFWQLTGRSPNHRISARKIQTNMMHHLLALLRFLRFAASRPSIRSFFSLLHHSRSHSALMSLCSGPSDCDLSFSSPKACSRAVIPCRLVCSALPSSPIRLPTLAHASFVYGACH